jgi:hypothetical protein
MLEDEGIIVTTTAALDIEKILANTDVEKLKPLSKLKYQIAPLLCRNKEDQDKVYKVFEKLDAKAQTEYFKQEKPPVAGPDSGDIKRKTGWQKLLSSWYIKRIIAPASIVLCLLLLVYFFKGRILN